ncbi:MAG: hypothetical protein HKN72_05420 [Gemmatimonadetes bacterium]|nr:capsule assembly Wzi family protein [Gemmatimonadota bacterium]NNF12637.1 hypothetical protein [Gemmatimonadota bacterium]
MLSIRPFLYFASLSTGMGAAMLGGGSLEAQSVRPGDPTTSYVRALSLTGADFGTTFTVLPGTDLSGPAREEQIPETRAHPWWERPYPAYGTAPSSGALALSVDEARVRTVLNSAVPRGWNDGAMWAGRGVTSSFDARASARWRGLAVVANPTVVFNQNRSYELATVLPPNQPPWAYPWRVVDWPQRFGPDSFWTLDPGDSRVSLDWKSGRVSVGNESLWWGPGVRNAIVMSNNAPGFLHAALSTNEPVDIGIGRLEGKWIWGGLGESDYFDPSAPSDRFITGIVLAYSPDWLAGLTVGGTRVFQTHVPDAGLPASEYLLVAQGFLKVGQVSDQQPDGSDRRDQILSLFARWAFPESGAEVYVEWARTDHALDLEDFLQEPEHSQGYTLGLQKVTSKSTQRMFLLSAELTHLEASTTFQLRPRPTYYTNSAVTQGYTHKGQILGAWVGPGGNSQFVGLEMFAAWGSVEMFVQRQVHDNDAFWVWAEANNQTFDAHHVSFDLGVDAMVFRGEVELGGGAVITRQINRWFYGPHLWNFNLSLAARWRPGA